MAKTWSLRTRKEATVIAWSRLVISIIRRALKLSTMAPQKGPKRRAGSDQATQMRDTAMVDWVTAKTRVSMRKLTRLTVSWDKSWDVHNRTKFGFLRSKLNVWFGMVPICRLLVVVTQLK